MTKIVAIILLVVFPVSLFAQNIPVKTTNETETEYEAGYYEGEYLAEQTYSGGGWGVAGFGGGFLLGLIGGGVIVGVSQIGKAEPPPQQKSRLLRQSTEYKIGFHDGYAKKIKKQRLKKSLVGGLIGTACAVALYVTMADRE